MFQYLLEMILPTYYHKNSDELSIDNSKNSDELSIDNSKNSYELSIDNSKISDEIWIKLLHIKLADLNRRVDEAKQNITNPKKPPQKHRHN